MKPLEGVRELRERRMLSQQELADRAGVSLFTVQRIERGEGSVRPKTGRAIAAALGVPIEELLPKVPRRSPAEPTLWNSLEEERREAAERYLRMPPDEFDERRADANAGEIDGAKFHEAVLHAYNAAEAEYRKLQQADALEEDLEEARELYREARKRWWVVVFDRAESTIALDERRDPEVVERADTRRLPLDEAYEEVRGRLGVTA